jgi:hypothetical protein
MSSPPGTGKTSCLQMFCRKSIPGMNRVYIKCNRGSSGGSGSGLDLLQQFGLDMTGIVCKIHPYYDVEDKKGVITVFILDNAEWCYTEHVLWDKILKHESYTPTHIRFLISVTHHIPNCSGDGGIGGAVKFDSMPTGAKLSMDKFLLNGWESKQFLKNYLEVNHRLLKAFATSDVTLLVQLIANDCRGNMSCLRIAIDELITYFQFHINPPPSYEQLVSHYLSKTMTERMTNRCFGWNLIENYCYGRTKVLVFNTNQQETMLSLLRELVYSGPKAYNYVPHELVHLVNCGMLSFHNGVLTFMSPLSKRYCMYYFYPVRTLVMDITSTTLLELLTKLVIPILQCAVVAKHHQQDSFYDVEVEYQHAFMRAIFGMTSDKVSIYPDLSSLLNGDDNSSVKSVSSGGNGRIKGELDFLLHDRDGKIRWGVELLIHSVRSTSEHKSRFEADIGKYTPLRMTDYIVVDIRHGVSSATADGAALGQDSPANIKYHEKRLTVFL